MRLRPGLAFTLFLIVLAPVVVAVGVMLRSHALDGFAIFGIAAGVLLAVSVGLVLVGRAFDRMAQQIDVRRAEIERMNTELQSRVDERTRQLRDAEEQLIQARVVAAASDIAAGVAHEINNPLAGILGMAQLLIAKAPSGAPELGHLRDIEREALRVKSIVLNLLELTQARTAGTSKLDVNEVVTRTLDLLESDLAEQKIALDRQLGDRLPLVGGNSLEIARALIEVVKNAQGAMPEGGTLTVTTRSIDHRLVEIAVRDTGRGIPRDHLDRVFDPFFTTKEDWGDIGLGLPLALKIVDRYNGKVKVESEIGKGTTVRVTFPALAVKGAVASVG